MTFQMHYTAHGHATHDRTAVGFRFATEPPAEEIFASEFVNGQFTMMTGFVSRYLSIAKQQRGLGPCSQHDRAGSPETSDTSVSTARHTHGCALTAEESGQPAP